MTSNDLHNTIQETRIRIDNTMAKGKAQMTSNDLHNTTQETRIRIDNTMAKRKSRK